MTHIHQDGMHACVFPSIQHVSLNPRARVNSVELQVYAYEDGIRQLNMTLLDTSVSLHQRKAKQFAPAKQTTHHSSFPKTRQEEEKHRHQVGK
jgi:hypothetical protein